MKKTFLKRSNPFQILRDLHSKLTLAAIAMTPGLVWADNSFGGADTKVTSFLSNLTGLLDIASIAIVTIAIVFAGYQIAFAHKRISDVAPILIGGLLIGAAGQLAKMIIGEPDTASTVGQVFIIVKSLASYA